MAPRKRCSDFVEKITLPEEKENPGTSINYSSARSCIIKSDHKIKYMNLYVENSDISSQTIKNQCEGPEATVGVNDNDDTRSFLERFDSTRSSSFNETYKSYPKVSDKSCRVPEMSLPNNIQYKSSVYCDEAQENEDEEQSYNLVTLDEIGFKCFDVFGWDDIRQPSKECVLKLLQFMISNYIRPNIQIHIGGLAYNCHLMVLQVFSDFFKEVKHDCYIDLPIKKVTPYAFKEIYNWMLTDKLILHTRGILEIFLAANYLRVNELVNHCWRCLDDNVQFREDIAFLLYLEARFYNLENVEHLMLSRVYRFFLPLVASQQFLDLECFELCQLLASNTIGVNTEIEVFMAVARWLDFDWDTRKKYLLQVSKNIRFSLMPPWFLVTFNRKTGCSEVDRIVDHPEIRKMINDGISYSTTQMYYNTTHKEFVHFLDRYQLVAPLHRQWIYDRRCFYHHRSDCTKMELLTFDIFQQYMECIRNSGKKPYWSTLENSKTIPSNFKCCDRYGEPRFRVKPSFVR